MNGCVAGMVIGVIMATQPPGTEALNPRESGKFRRLGEVCGGCKLLGCGAISVREDYLLTVASVGSLERRHHFSSWLISVISMPGMTMNLQESISRGSSSSGSWQVTRQYWQSWFQQKRP